MAPPQILILPEAEADLGEIEAYLAAEAGPRIAERNLTRIIDKLHVLAAFPGIGRKREAFSSAPHSFTVTPWIVVDRPLPEQAGIAVLRILHGRRNLAKLMDED